MEATQLVQYPSTETQTSIHPAAHAVSFVVSSILENNLAYLMGMETLRHGTTFGRAVNIMREGADPQRGGSGASATATNQRNVGIAATCKGHFHVVKDEDFEFLGMNNSLVKGVTAKAYAGYTGYGKASRFKKAKAIFHFIFSPTIRFHYTKEERKAIFEEDPDSKSMALRTVKHLPNDRIGLAGVIKHGTFKGFRQQAAKNPLKTAKAIAGVFFGTLLTCTGLGFVI